MNVQRILNNNLKKSLITAVAVATPYFVIAKPIQDFKQDSFEYVVPPYYI